MVITTRRTAGKGKAVTYKEPDSDDDIQMNDATPPPAKGELDEQEPPMKKLRTGINSSSPIPPQQDVQASESDDDYEASSSKKRKSPKSAAATKGKGKSKDKGKAKAQLHTLFDKLPTDVVYLSSASIWREAREEVDPPVPDCPPDQTSYLGPRLKKPTPISQTSTCYLNYSPIPTVRNETFSSKKPAANLHIKAGSSYRGKYYRMKDIEDIGAEWIAIKKKGSEAEIQEFKDTKKSETEEIMTHGAFCKVWERDRSILKRKQNRDMKQARRDDIFARLEALGHDSRDVRDWRVYHSRHFHSSTPLTEQRWKSIRRGLEVLVNEAKVSRHQRERSEIVRQRESLAENLIDAYYTTSDTPSAFRPRARALFQAEPFRAIIEQPNDVTVYAADFQAAVDALPDLVAAGAREVQLAVLQRMLDGGATNVGSPITPSDFDKIELATSTFFCKSMSPYNVLPICGGSDMDSHRCYLFRGSESRHQCLLYDHRASSTVAALIAAANLDPTITVDQMDQLDLRWHCPDLEGEAAQLALNWRDAVCNRKALPRIQALTLRPPSNAGTPCEAIH
ncbi:hypothetical protein FS837_010215 [Tulasnella sp. UAMH 9824]|nr:hypothetical protein FS837_010215 [Tulasnella sp. UAMH 9824]